VPEMCCVVVDRYMAGSLQRSCVPIHEYPIFFSFFFYLWLGLRAMRLVTVTCYFFSAVCAVAGHVELFSGALEGVWWLQVTWSCLLVHWTVCGGCRSR
jgi:hypothetical protein